MLKKEKKRSFFERISGGIRLSEEDDTEQKEIAHAAAVQSDPWTEEESEGELAIDVYQTPSDIILQTFVAGVRPEDLEINITRDMITIRGKRAENAKVETANFFSRELYWGAFSRTISLPQEIEPEGAEAIERHGLLTIRLPKIDKDKKSNLKVKSV